MADAADSVSSKHAASGKSRGAVECDLQRSSALAMILLVNAIMSSAVVASASPGSQNATPRDVNDPWPYPR